MQVTINGRTYSDDADPEIGLAGGGHRTRFIPALQDVVAVAGQVAAAAATALSTGEAASQAEEDALFAAGYTMVIRIDLVSGATTTTTTPAPTTTTTPAPTTTTTTTPAPGPPSSTPVLESVSPNPVTAGGTLTVNVAEGVPSATPTLDSVSPNPVTAGGALTVNVS